MRLPAKTLRLRNQARARSSTLIKYVRSAAIGAAGNDLGTTIKYLRRTRNGAAGNNLGTAIKPPVTNNYTRQLPGHHDQVPAWRRGLLFNSSKVHRRDGRLSSVQAGGYLLCSSTHLLIDFLLSPQAAVWAPAWAPR
jgi:hypothetical protein